MGRDRNVSTRSFNLGLANRKDEVYVSNFVTHVELDAVHHLVLEEDHGVVVPNCCLKQASGVFSAPRRDNFEARYISIPRSEALGVLGADT